MASTTIAMVKWTRAANSDQWSSLISAGHLTCRSWPAPDQGLHGFSKGLVLILERAVGCDPVQVDRPVRTIDGDLDVDRE